MVLKLKELSDLHLAAGREKNPTVKAHLLKVNAHITEQAERIAQLEEQLADQILEVTAVNGKRVELMEQLAQAQEDTKRLDCWAKIVEDYSQLDGLDPHQPYTVLAEIYTYRTALSVSVGDDDFEGETFRQAIDQIIDKAKAGKEE